MDKIIEGGVIEGLVIEDGVIEDGVIKGWVIETVIILWLPGMTLASSKNRADTSREASALLFIFVLIKYINMSKYSHFTEQQYNDLCTFGLADSDKTERE